MSRWVPGDRWLGQYLGERGVSEVPNKRPRGGSAVQYYCSTTILKCLRKNGSPVFCAVHDVKIRCRILFLERAKPRCYYFSCSSAAAVACIDAVLLRVVQSLPYLRPETIAEPAGQRKDRARKDTTNPFLPSFLPSYPMPAMTTRFCVAVGA